MRIFNWVQLFTLAIVGATLIGLERCPVNAQAAIDQSSGTIVATAPDPLAAVSVTVDRSSIKQTIIGFGGDFCQARYGSVQTIDGPGSYNLAHLDVAQARVGIPLDYWTPAKGVYNDTAQAHAAFLLMQMLQAKGIPIIGTVWEGPTWMLPGLAGQGGRVLDPAEYSDCIDAIAQFLVTARDKYGVTVDYYSFNEANGGVNFYFPPTQIDQFIRQAGPRFAALGLKTKFLVGDTTGGAPFADYVKPLLADPLMAPYLGPLAFHSWDALSASDSQYDAIAAVSRSSGKPVYCTEAGWDAMLWQRPGECSSWENALRTAQVYARTLRLSGASTMDYWTYEDNYGIVSSDGTTPYPVFNVIKQIADSFPAGCKVVGSSTDTDGIETLASVGPRRGQFSMLIVDTAGAADVTVMGLPAGLHAECIESTETAQGVRGSDLITADRAGDIKLTVGARSVVTVVGPSK